MPEINKIGRFFAQLFKKGDLS